MKILLIIDIDNTIAENAHREHLLPDWSAFYHACDKDESIVPILEAIKPFLSHDLVEPIFVTGRTGYEGVKAKTEVWLKDREIENLPVHYRGLKDFSKAFIFKEKVLNQEKKEHHSNVVILDDDVKIIEHFSNLGHSAIQVTKDNYHQTATNLKETMENLINNINQKNKKSIKL